MNYQKIYDLLIKRARHRILDSYFESHHVIPKCMGGMDSSENLVDLTPEEHFLCHQLLVKIYKDTEYYQRLVFACHMMTRSFSNTHNRNLSKLKMFGWLRRAHSKALSSRPAHNKGKPHSEDHKRKLSLSSLGRKREPRSEETKAKISEKLSGRKLSSEAREKLKLRRKRTPEEIETHRQKVTGLKRSEITKQSMRKPKARVCCILCHKESSNAVIVRHHNNCYINYITLKGI